MATFQARFLETSESFKAEFGDVTIVEKGFDPYPGPYTVIPKTVEQILATKQKDCTDDITVTEIPYAETSNVYGTTVTIAS